MLNNITLAGRLTADPELRYTASGVALTSFTLAVGRDYKNAAGERLRRRSSSSLPLIAAKAALP